MAKRRRSKKRKFDDGLNWPAAAAMFTVVVAIAGLIGFSVTTETFDVDEQTLCRLGQEPSAVLAVVIDSTDAIPSGPARRAYHSIMSAVDSSPSNTLIQVFKIEGSATQLASPIISICKPEDGSDVSVLNANPDDIRKVYSERFEAPLDDVLKNLIDEDSANQSPIIEAIQSASLSLFMPNESVADKRLIIASDFLQHSSIYSMYGGMPDYASFQKNAFASPLGRVDLYGSKVSLLVVPREIPVGAESDLIGFWNAFLANHRAAPGSSMEAL